MADDILTKQENLKYARQIVDRFVGSFGESYRLLAYHAALPLVLTPELLNYLRNQFLRGQVPWVAEADLLLSNLCSPAGYEQYVMDQAVRDYLLAEMKEQPDLGSTRMQEVARLLIHYIRHLSRTNSKVSKKALQTQQWAAMVYLDDHHEFAVREIAESFRNSVTDPAEMGRLAQITQSLAPELEKYANLVQYANHIGHLLSDPTGTEQESYYQPPTILDVALPAPESIIKQPRYSSDQIQKLLMEVFDQETILEIFINEHFPELYSSIIGALDFNRMAHALAQHCVQNNLLDKLLLLVRGLNPSKYDELGFSSPQPKTTDTSESSGPPPLSESEVSFVTPTPADQFEAVSPEIRPDTPTTYTVQRGDTLGRIAAKVYGDARKYPIIQRANNLPDPGRIWVGQVLVTPPLGGTASSATTSSPVSTVTTTPTTSQTSTPVVPTQPPMPSTPTPTTPDPVTGAVTKPQVEWVGSPNYNQRRNPSDITAIVIHSTANSTLEGVISWFNNPDAKVSAHYTIGKDGRIVQHVRDQDRAWHAGLSVWKGRNSCNDYAIGIELVNLNDGSDPYPEAQHQANVAVCAYLRRQYNIKADDIIGHVDIALPPGRKSDPRGYDLDRLRSEVAALLGVQPPPAGPETPAYKTRYVSHNTPTTVVASQTLYINLTIQNVGSVTWLAGGQKPFRLGFQWYDAAGQLVQFPSELDYRTPLLQDVPTGGQVSLQARLRTPDAFGTFQLRWDMVHEMVTWFTTQGDAGLLISPMTVSPAFEAASPPVSESPTHVQVQDISQVLAQHLTKHYEIRPLKAIRRVIIHHTATPATVTIMRIADYQVNSRDLPGISYHYCITAEGIPFLTQPAEVQTMHSGNHSGDSLGVCLIGNFTNSLPPRAQLNGTAVVLAQLLAEFNINIDQIVGYSELVASGSPGATWHTWKGPLLELTKRLMVDVPSVPTTPPVPVPKPSTKLAPAVVSSDIRASFVAASRPAPPIQNITQQLKHHPTLYNPVRSASQIDRIIIHHTAVPPSIGAERIAEYLVQTRGQSGIAYHYFITGDGIIQQTNELTTITQQSLAQFNPVAVGVGFAGDFSDAVPSSAQVEAGAQLIAWLISQLNLSLQAVFGHKELINTQSPGLQWDSGSRWGDQLRQRIQAYLI